jgi:hypothetical protein
VGRGKEKMGLEMVPRIGHMKSGSWPCGLGELMADGRKYEHVMLPIVKLMNNHCNIIVLLLYNYYTIIV